MLESLQNWINSLELEPLIIVGLMVGAAFYLGKTMKFIRLPSIIGFMIIGVLLGPSVFNLLSEGFQEELSFLTDLALGFVAVSIGLELSFTSLKKQGAGIITVIFSESLAAFVVVTTLIYFLTSDLPMALIFGAIAPASAPAGTVAIIQEYKAKGPLTRALYSVVGFDDGLGIIIFGFAAAFAKSFLGSEMGIESGSFLELVSGPLLEVGLSLLVGGGLALIYVLLGRLLKTSRDMFILLFALVLLGTGLSHHFHLSLILTNMVFGLVVVNTQKRNFVEKVHHELSEFMPLLFIIFFVLAGANLHISALPSLGILGVVYISGRSLGLVGGAKIGAHLGNQPQSIKKYLGMGILSQAGVAIGLALIVKKEFADFGAHGMDIGSTVITTVTATSLFFEIIGPILTKIGLSKAGEIGQAGK